MPHANATHAMNPIRLAACAALLAIAAGCASSSLSPSALTSGQFADPARGVVLVSTGAVQRCSATAMWAPIYVGGTHELAPGRPVVPIDEPVVSAFQDHFGTVSAVSLPAGRYVITAEYANPLFDSGRVPAYSFEVEAGQAVYIGELWRVSSCGVGSLVLRDNYDRDVALAGNLNKQFVAHPPKKALAQPLRGAPGR